MGPFVRINRAPLQWYMPRNVHDINGCKQTYLPVMFGVVFQWVYSATFLFITIEVRMNLPKKSELQKQEDLNTKLSKVENKALKPN